MLLYLCPLCLCVLSHSFLLALSISSSVQAVKHDTLTQCWVSVGPPSTTLNQHKRSIGLPCRDQLLFPPNTEHLYNMCTTSAQRLRRWCNNCPTCTNVIQMFCVYWVERSKRSKHEALNQCWFEAEPVLQTVGQNWVNVVFAGCVDKCFAPKRNNTFRLIHCLYCPQESFDNIHYKSH